MQLYFVKLFLIVCACSYFASGSEKCPEIISRTRWGARVATRIDYSIIPIEYVVIHHTVTDACDTEIECSEILTNIQNFHIEELDFDDIGYNFLVGGDGNIYEGIGFHKIGAHTYGYNSRSLGIAFIGNFTSKLPNEKQLNITKQLLNCAVDNGELDKRYKVLGARQVSSTQSPGLTLYHEIQKWEHFARKP